MIKKELKFILNVIRYNIGYIIFLFIMTFVLFYKFDYYIFSPGSLIDLTDRIKVENSYEEKGSFNLTYVTSRPGTLANIVLSKIIPSWDLIDMDESRIENESEKDIFERDKIYLKETSYDAIIAAFKASGLEYKVDSIDVTVTYVYDMANTDLKVGDVIKSINGNNINSFEDLKNEVDKYKEKDVIDILVTRNNKDKKCYSILTKSEDRVVIGVSLAELKNVVTSPKVEYIFKDYESGSSRGFMCALDIYNKITEFDLTKGRKISGTGTIDEDGNVGSIDGVKYKLKGAVNNKSDIFLVPTKNYEEAVKLKEKYNYDIEIIEADTLENVIEKLK